MNAPVRTVLLGGFPPAYAAALRRSLGAGAAWAPLAVPDARALRSALHAAAVPPAFVLLNAAALGPAAIPMLCSAVRALDPTGAATRLEALMPNLAPDAVRAAYRAGADECRRGPIPPETLALVIAEKAPPAPSELPGAVRRDPATGTVVVDGRRMPLTVSEDRLLCELAARPGCIRSRSDLLCALHGADAGSVLLRAVDSTVSDLRNKLGPAAWRLETAWGRGYRWNAAAPRRPRTARLVLRRAGAAGTGLLGVLFVVLAARRGASPMAPPSPPEPSVSAALRSVFGTGDPPAVDVAHPPSDAEDDFWPVLPG